MLPQLLADLRGYLHVVEHTPGRLRLKVDLGVRNDPAAARLRDMTPGSVPGLRSYRFNVFTQTLAIEYDPEILPHALLSALFTATNGEQLADAVKALTAATA